jgi:hypothetical protein
MKLRRFVIPIALLGLRLLSITSDKNYLNLNEKQNEISPKLEIIINGSNYNITSVKTSYSSGYLVAAEITYDTSGYGEGNELRVILIQSNKENWDEKADEIRSQLDEVVNSERYDILDINTTCIRGSLRAAEVYYQEKR